MSSREDAIRNDALIQDIAIYELTKGNTKALQKEDLDALQNRFSEYKGLIRRGEFTYDELADTVFRKYGIIEPLIQPSYSTAPREMPDRPPASKEDVEEFINVIKKLAPPSKPLKLRQKIWNAICVALSRLNVNI